MNLLFLNYGDFTSNSLNHIGAFANRLTEMGHACVVAVPEGVGTLSVLAAPLFRAVTFEQLQGPEPLFPDHRPADVLHAWTPRENVRRAALAYLAASPATALLIHLEDNERFLSETFAGATSAELERLGDTALEARLTTRLSHPTRFPLFLRLAHGITYITDRLREFCPQDARTHRLLPGVDAALYRPQPADASLRVELDLAPEEKVIVFTGSTTFANLADVRALILAVRALNERGCRCRLLRTGINPPEYEQTLAGLGKAFILNLGFIEKSRLPALLALADVLVQPGAPDDFNEYRLPSKVPEFLSMGKPVVLPRANLAHEMQHGVHALLLEQGTPQEIADHCWNVIHDSPLANRLGSGALDFARRHFDLEANTRGLLAFYEQVRNSARPLSLNPADPTAEDLVFASSDPVLAIRLAQRARDQIDLRHRVAQLGTELANSDADRSEMQAHAEMLRRESASLAAERDFLQRQLGLAVERQSQVQRERDEARLQTQQLAAQLAQRDDKIRRMSKSFSWQVTSPLRALRRRLIDGRHRSTSEPPRVDSPAREVIAPGFVVHFEQPSNGLNLSPHGQLRGWILPPAGTGVMAVQARIGDRLFSLTSGVRRPDLIAQHPHRPDAITAGFEGDVKLTPGTEDTLRLEVLTHDGRWQLVHREAVRVATSVSPHDPAAYAAWLEHHGPMLALRASKLTAEVQSLPAEQQPLISVVMPTYNTPETWLTRAIESVRAQSYPHWELCIADDASTDSRAWRLIEAFAARDPRIKCVARPVNGHISAASNTALDLARGTWVALLDHDDELAPHALASLVHAMHQRPEVAYIYSDEDKIDEQGRRFDPNFKPDWNPDLLQGQNYCCHLSAVRTDLVREVGGFREGTEGSQDWDLILRVTERLEPNQILHIPDVLYHWRAIRGSTALHLGEKSYITATAERVLREHLQRTRTNGELHPVPGGHWRIRRPRPPGPPLVSLIIPTHNGERLLRQCIDSVRAHTTYPRFELLIVNNRSDNPGTLSYFRQLSTEGVRVLDYDAPFNFSALNNFAVRHTRGEILGFLNNDIEATHDDWLDEMVSHVVRPEIGAVGARLLYPDRRVQHAGIVLGIAGPMREGGVAGHPFKGSPSDSPGYFNRLQLVQSYSALTAACLLVRRPVFDEVGGFNEAHLAVAFNDVDFCLRVQALGYRNLYTPFAELVHHESASRGAEDTPAKQARFNAEIRHMRQTWGALLDRDPAYNPNLTFVEENFGLAWPPRPYELGRIPWRSASAVGR